MRGQPLQHVLTPWEERLNAQLRAFIGLREHPRELHDKLDDIRTHLANQETLLQQLLEAVEAPPSPTTASTPHLSAPLAFEFSDDINKPPVINGNTKPKLTVTQHDILMELVKAGPGGVSMKELDDNSDHPEARKTLKKLAKDADWRSVIVFPEKKNQGGYRLRFS